MVKKKTDYDGKKYLYYVCKTNKELHACSGHRMTADELENTVLTILQKHIQSVVDMNDILNELGNLPFRQIHLKKAEERLKQVEGEIDRYRNLKILLYEDMKEEIVSKNDYLEINQQYEERIKAAQKSLLQIKKEMDRLLHNTTEEQLWIQDFMKYRNLKTLTRTAVVELIEKVRIYEDKKVVVEFCHFQDYEQLAGYIKELYGAGEIKEVI